MSDLIPLDGRWTLHVGDTPDATPATLDALAAHEVEVPGLWEAQGFLHLDGVAWYRRTFDLDDTSGRRRLRFGAVMDSAEVWLNGVHVGGHDLQPFTPFEFDVTDELVAGTNVLAVRVVDPAADDPDVLRSAHGKQGWQNDVFPSPPSLYATYGGIWQSVTLRRCPAVTIEDVFVSPDPDRVEVTVELTGPAGVPVTGTLGVTAAGLEAARPVTVHAVGRTVVRIGLGPSDAEPWSPDDPVLHTAEVTFSADATPDVPASWSGRFGLRTIRTEAGRLLLNGEPLRLRSALVQGFRPDTLYGAGGREAIEAEVRAARDAGFNALRLHIKAFEPDYLDVCDELGMLLHCDIPVAEPLDHADLGADTDLARRCVESARGQVRRDRNHPSVILWSAMNEIGLGRPQIRLTSGYEAFARTLVAAVRAEDPTRPIIENDWIEPDPEHVFDGDLVTAHWYGRLRRDYLEALEGKTIAQRGGARPLLVSEFGDWGLPGLRPAEPGEFWDQSESLARGIADAGWEGTAQEFVEQTQRYQGLSDRLQGEVFRRHDHVAGFCLTELTDVPRELNGVLDFHRRPKAAAVDEVRRLNAPVLPMARLGSFTASAGGTIAVELAVANDGPAQDDLTLVVELGGAVVACRGLATLRAHGVTDLGAAEIRVPDRAGDAELRLSLRGPGGVVARNAYPLWVIAARHPEIAVRLVGAGPIRDALDRIGVAISGEGPLVVAEGALTGDTAPLVRDALAAGETVVVMHQNPDSSPHWPIPVRLVSTRPEWGSTVFQFTRSDLGWVVPAARATADHRARRHRGVGGDHGRRGWPTGGCRRARRRLQAAPGRPCRRRGLFRARGGGAARRLPVRPRRQRRGRRGRGGRGAQRPAHLGRRPHRGARRARGGRSPTLPTGTRHRVGHVVLRLQPERRPLGEAGEDPRATARVRACTTGTADSIDAAPRPSRPSARSTWVRTGSLAGRDEPVAGPGSDQ